MAEFLLDEREISECSYVVDWIPGHIKNASPGDQDLLTEVQAIEGFRRPLFDDLVTHPLELGVVHWLQVGNHYF